MNIVGICGAAGSGKSTAASVLVREFGFVEVALADPLKRICKEVFDFTDEQLFGPSHFRNEPDRRYYVGPRTFTYPHGPIGSLWLPLSADNGFALVDTEDFERVVAHKWQRNKKESGKTTDYARTRIDGEAASLHNFIFDNYGFRPEGHLIDHVNGDGLDNRRANLRACTLEENRANQKKRIDGVSPFKGVGPTNGGKWRAFATENGKFISNGTYEREAEAALAYDAYAAKRWGAFARLNTNSFLTPRHALQTLGTEWGRGCYPDVWVDYALRTIEALHMHDSEYTPSGGRTPGARPIGRFVIPDLRFPNEVAAIKKAGGKIWKVIRADKAFAGLEAIVGWRAHESEAHVDQLEADQLIFNGGSDLADYQRAVRDLAKAVL